MIKIKEAVIVEGKYDKIRLESLLDALIIPTNGFSVFKDREKMRFIRRMADERGILILTDSDHAGFQIRAYLADAVGKDKVKHAYIPDVFGKERRKSEPSKEGKLGVEGMETQTLLKALKKAGVTAQAQVPDETAVRITNADLFNDGFSGRPNSKKLKHALLKEMDLPEFLSTSSLLNVLNFCLTFEEYGELADRVNQNFNGM